MLKPGDTAYFVFKGNFNTGRYRNFYCLPSELKYFPFYPVKIRSTGSRTSNYSIEIGTYTDWLVLEELLEKEFHLVKFINANFCWDGKMTKYDYNLLAKTLRAGSSNGRTDRS